MINVHFFVCLFLFCVFVCVFVCFFFVLFFLFGKTLDITFILGSLVRVWDIDYDSPSRLLRLTSGGKHEKSYQCSLQVTITILIIELKTIVSFLKIVIRLVVYFYRKGKFSMQIKVMHLVNSN